MTKIVRIATRHSELALYQAREVASRLKCDFEIVEITSSGDRDLISSLSQIGGTGIFVKEVQNALLEGRADIAVHSAKDLPGVLPEATTIAGYLPRGDIRDAIFGSRISDLREGAIVATGSARRRALLLSKRPDVKVVDLRGNIRSRLSKVGEVDAILVANAALVRLGIDLELGEIFEPEEFCPQIGQGAIAIEARLDDLSTLELVREVSDSDTFLQLTAERSLLATLGAGCTLAVGAYSSLIGPRVSLFGMISSSDGDEFVTVKMESEDPGLLGQRAGAFLLENGGSRLLSNS